MDRRADEPEMIAILQWTTLALCALLAVARIPSALRGENRWSSC